MNNVTSRINTFLKLQKEAEMNCYRKLKGKQRKRRRARQKFLKDFSTILETNRGKY